MPELFARLRVVLALQLLWVLATAAWHFAGFVMVQQGQPAPGPASSVTGALLYLAIGLGLFDGIRRWPLAYAGVSVVAGVIAASLLVKATIPDPTLWPSDDLRWSAIGLNALGVLAAIAAIVGYGLWWLRQSNARPTT